MSKTVLDMSMSLDGFIAGPNDGPQNGLGDGGEPLHAWLGEWNESHRDFDPPGASGAVFEEALATGALVVGRKMFDYAGHWNGDHHSVPIYVPTRGEPPEPQSEWVHYVTDGVESAVSQAKEAAGNANVLVHGAELAQSMLRAGVLDEMEIHIVPMLLGEGRPLFADGEQPRDLKLTRVLEAPGVTHLHFEVRS